MELTVNYTKVTHTWFTHFDSSSRIFTHIVFVELNNFDASVAIKVGVSWAWNGCVLGMVSVSLKSSKKSWHLCVRCVVFGLIYKPHKALENYKGMYFKSGIPPERAV